MCNSHFIESPATFHHGARSRFNAWFFNTFNGYVNLATKRHKQRAFADMHAGTVLELGAGSGANFKYLPAGSHLLALEPNEAMHPFLLNNARNSGIDLQLIPASAEAIPLPDNSVDVVIASLVLCTVSDLQAVLAEVRRILRPGGTFRFVEHIAAHPASPRRWIQQLIARPWAWLFEGCDTHRDTPKFLSDAGFNHLFIQKRRFRLSIFFPVNSGLWGIATN